MPKPRFEENVLNSQLGLYGQDALDMVKGYSPIDENINVATVLAILEVAWQLKGLNDTLSNAHK